MTLTPPPSYDAGPPYDDGTGGRGPAYGRRRRIPARAVLFGVLLLVVIVLTSSGSLRDWWAHRLHDLTNGSEPANYVIGLVVGLLPVIGVGVGAIRTRGARRVIRMMTFGGIGFLLTYLLAPSPARYLVHRDSGNIFKELAPGYLAGVYTGVVIWFLALLVALFTIRSWWRRLTARLGQPDPGNDPAHRIIDI